MGEFADHMKNEMSIRGFSEETQRAYLACMRSFVKYCRLSPDKVAEEEINRFQIHLTKERKVSWSRFNQHVCAIMFFFKHVIKRPWVIKHIPYHKREKRLPVVLSRQEILKLLAAMPKIKHRAIFLTIYSTGLRAREAAGLKPHDIESDRMLIRVNQGKGKKDRYVMLSPLLLAVLREYWKTTWASVKAKPEYLFPGTEMNKPMSRKTVWWLLKKVAQEVGIDKYKVTSRILRHTFSTHLLEDGVNIRVIQAVLGHRSLRTTAIYTHVAANYLTTTPTPLDTLCPGVKAKEAGR
jgi:integrase/recombinase XerD